MGRRRKPNAKNAEGNTPPTPPVEGDTEAVEAAFISTKSTEPLKPEDVPATVTSDEPVSPTGAAAHPVPPVGNAKAPAVPGKVERTPAPTTAAAEAASLDGVEALNAYALKSASCPVNATDSASFPAEKANNEDHLPAQKPSEIQAILPRTQTKKVAFNTPVVSSVASVSDVEAPRESSCVEASCGSCTVM
ncbi:hypothetical protein ABL78_5550 [Leptomonas seymouri]|uniref:Uncharacterized protein n=1 Tax=Leptomonas seymouri TaxID=5684 RepID=A0A0N0P4J4_LEPSE|nr:hypothetical protein ABL78_5550 [Leptomonas seymouri]|eukprot:KPI85369.1 hypothetical protein ABL78_5550 [Leptomonas seymouri]